MRFVAGIWRLAIVALCVMGTSEAWTQPNRWVYFTFQTGALVGFVMLWAGAASLVRGVQPPAWLKGAATTYAIVVALVAFTMLPPDDPRYVPQIMGIMTNTMLRRIVPAMVVLDFLLFDEHRRLKASYPLLWLIYPPLYLTFVLVRAWWWPHAGPGAGGSPYPYDFLNLPAVGWAQFGIACLKVLAAFLASGAVVCLVDRALPEHPLAK